MTLLAVRFAYCEARAQNEPIILSAAIVASLSAVILSGSVAPSPSPVILSGGRFAPESKDLFPSTNQEEREPPGSLESRVEVNFYFTSASKRTGAPEPFSSFIGATTTVDPAGGTCARLATFSK